MVIIFTFAHAQLRSEKNYKRIFPKNTDKEIKEILGTGDVGILSDTLIQIKNHLPFSYDTYIHTHIQTYISDFKTKFVYLFTTFKSYKKIEAHNKNKLPERTFLLQ